jgi:predicted 2-oxoglutarate/Fe(II)-dependent dioxygenase YbiX
MILTKKECDEIISWSEEFNIMNVRECSDVCSPNGLHKSKLDYEIAEVKRTPQTQWIFDKISHYLSLEYPNNKVSEREYFYLHKFEEGHKFTKHIDKDRQNDWVLVVGGILNDDFEGGRLLTYNPNGELATKMGELYTMDACILHEVTEITKGVRHSFVFFIEHKDLGLKKDVI